MSFLFYFAWVASATWIAFSLNKSKSHNFFFTQAIEGLVFGFFSIHCFFFIYNIIASLAKETFPLSADNPFPKTFIDIENKDDVFLVCFFLNQCDISLSFKFSVDL